MCVCVCVCVCVYITVYINNVAEKDYISHLFFIRIRLCILCEHLNDCMNYLGISKND